MKLICNYCEAHMPEVPEGSGNHVCPNGHHSSTPQSPKEALPGKIPPRVLIHWLPDFKDAPALVYPATEANRCSTCRDYLSIEEHESALAEAVRKARAEAFEEVADKMRAIPFDVEAGRETLRKWAAPPYQRRGKRGRGMEKSKYWICDKCAEAKGWKPPTWAVTCIEGECAWCDKGPQTLTPTCDFAKPGMTEPVWD